jgi:membrane fusion protein, multidrug efflux system
MIHPFARIAAIVFLGVLTLCCERSAPAARAPASAPHVRTVAAWTGDVDLVVDAVGQIRAIESVSLATEVAGRVATINFEEASVVSAGTVLVQLDDRRARADFDAAQAARDLAARQLERYQQAASIAAASMTELDTIRTELTRAEAHLELARIRVDDHRVVAPFDGQVGLRLVSPGAHVQAGDPLTTMITVDPMEIEFTVPEVYLARLRPGLALTSTSPAFEGREFSATVRVVSPQVDSSTRTALVLARAANPEGVLRPGMFAHVRLVVGQRRDAVLVPEAAVEFQGTQAWLYVIADETAQRRAVQLGERRAGLTEVMNGLAAGEQVVVAGLQKIRDGAKVQSVPIDTPSGRTRNMGRPPMLTTGSAERPPPTATGPAAPSDGERH